MTEPTRDETVALAHARHLAENGVPVFLARPAKKDGEWDPSGGHNGCGYWLPAAWEETEADPSVVDRWKPGMALCAVMGHEVDALDVDPRNGGDLASLNGTMPKTYGLQSTPSGGEHHLIASLGVRNSKPYPGIDLQAGDGEGGHGFVFLAPTRRRSKGTGEVRAYEWLVAPDIALLAVVGGDDSGAALAEHVRSRRPVEYDGPEYDGPAYDELPPALREWADRHVAEQIEKWRARFTEALSWDLGGTDDEGRGWEMLARDGAWALARLATCPWTGLDEDAARQLYDEVLPEEIAQDEVCKGKWDRALVARAAQKPIPPPPWDTSDDFDQWETAEDLPEVPTRLDDAHMAAWMARKGLGGEWCWAGGLGWLHWDGRRWVPRREEDAREALRRSVIEVNKAALESGVTDRELRALAGLLSTGRIGALTSLMKGVVSVESGAFDQQPDLLNVGNGVVDLRTGELLPHDPTYRLTKITETHYKPGATHPDWDKALGALDAEVADWMQVRFGQAATGYPTSDDVLTIGQGGGSNGKSTILSALFVALGGHMVQVPEKLLRASPNDHPTELMTLYGARVAVIDETPEVAQLNVQRLKATVGQEWMTARPVHKDNVTWRATHSLFVMTNYTPMVRETDHGTWRRLALVRFTRTFPKDDRFRARMARGAGGRKEAVLAWVVQGARRWYDAERVIPPAPDRVEEDTQHWRSESDLVLAYLRDGRVVFDSRACVLASDLLDDFNEWLFLQGHQTWSAQTLTSRFGNHDEVTRRHVSKSNPRDPAGLVLRTGDGGVSGRPNVWRGVRWATAEERAGSDGSL